MEVDRAIAALLNRHPEVIGQALLASLSVHSGARARTVFPENTPKSAIARKRSDLRSGLFYPYYSKQAT
jgi:hypothetical protein